MSDDELRKIAERFGTPCYVFDEEAFSERLGQARALAGEGFGLCFSMKANPFLVEAACAQGLKIEVCSPGELAICRHLGVDGARIIYSGVCKGTKDVDEALAYGVGCFTAESPRQLALVDERATHAGARVPLLLRLSGGSQFGMSREDLFASVQNRDELAGCELVGIHYFVGTQRSKTSHQRRDLQMLEALLDELEFTLGWAPQRVEYGPGLAVPLFTDDDFSQTLGPLEGLLPGLASLAQRTELTVEMGRFFATECGFYLTRVVDQKDVETTRYAFVDGGMNHVTYQGQMMGLKEPVIENLSARARDVGDVACEDEDASWALCGSLCTTADVLVREAHLNDLRMGDLLAFQNIGAYSITEGIYLFLSRDMPAVVLRDARGFRLARGHVESWRLNTLQAR